MRSIHDKYFICEAGHVTCGNSSRTKCGAELYQLNYTKGKRKGQWNPEYTKKEKPCDKPIVSEGVIPEKLNLLEVWPHETMHAFLIGQKFDAEFMVSIQEAFCNIIKMISTQEKRKIEKQ